MNIELCEIYDLSGSAFERMTEMFERGIPSEVGMLTPIQMATIAFCLRRARDEHGYPGNDPSE